MATQLEEPHRFAITFHRARRGKSFLEKKPRRGRRAEP
jgi:excinuclease UvrABC nuclease subunit